MTNLDRAILNYRESDKEDRKDRYITDEQIQEDSNTVKKA